jgi:hypothetical protein
VYTQSREVNVCRGLRKRDPVLSINNKTGYMNVEEIDFGDDLAPNIPNSISVKILMYGPSRVLPVARIIWLTDAEPVCVSRRTTPY